MIPSDDEKRQMPLRTIFAAISFHVLTIAPVMAQTPNPSAFMAGCWAEPGELGAGLREHFTAPTANLTLGVSRFLSDGHVVEFEFHRIEPGSEGWTLTPHPGGVASVPFVARDVASDRVVWSNPDHDFPQRIIYHRVADDTLVVRIEGETPGGTRAREWRMAADACGSRGDSR